MRSPLSRLTAACIVFTCLLAPTAASAADPAVSGKWSSLTTYPVTPVSMGLMPDGKVVAWDQANRGPQFSAVPSSGPAMILDPATGAIERSVNTAPTTLFCSLLTSLPDGRLAVVGGGVDANGGASAKVQVYDEDSRTFSTIGEMERPRWYPGGTLDRNGNVIVGGGSGGGIERIDENTGTSTLLNGSLSTNWYPDFIRTPDDRFAIEDVGDNTGNPIGRFLLSGNSLTSIADRTLLKNRYRGIRTEIGPHRMFWSSGGTSTESMIIDASGSAPRYTPAASSRFRHMTGTATTLPTGDVLAIGGNSSNQSTIGTPVMTPELYSPATDSWTTMEDAARQRQYHSVAALMPDGRVWSAGTSYNGAQEPNGQFFSPPYLFERGGSGRLASRPTATDAPRTITPGRAFSVATDDPARIASASLVRLAGNTHQINPGQAFAKLTTTVSGGRVSMTAPGVDATPPGYYMLFLVDDHGVPSVAPIVRLDNAAGAGPKPRASQSSQLGRANAASKAIDGNTDGDSGRGSVTHTMEEDQPWWQVDLGESRDLGSVTLHMRGDCCTERSRDLWVFASDTPMRSTTVDGLRAQEGVTAVRVQTPAGTVNTVALGRRARYLRVQKPDRGFLSLAEVVPNAPGAGPPPSPVTTQSSTAFDAPAWRAFDGVTDGQFARGSVTHTAPEDQPWWQVDLGSSRRRGGITIYHRADCCTDRSRDLWVLTSDDPIAGRTVAEARAQSGVTATRVQTPKGTRSDVPLGRSARYVRIQSTGNQPLSLAEVVPWDGASPPPAPVTSQSSTWFDASAARAFDGNTDGWFFNWSVTRTDWESEPWWLLDLGVSRRIAALTIFHRTDCCTDRSRDLWVLTSDQPITGRSVAQARAQSSVTATRVQTTSGTRSTVTLDRSARYVRIQSAGDQPLSLAEVAPRFD